MAEKNRASLLAIVEESVEGTYEAPTLGTQFIALQEGFSFNPNFEQLENAEIRASIGVSKQIQGLENPEGTVDHYLRASGVEGQAPNFGPLLKALLGSASVNATERVTTTGSTVSVVALAAGGSDFARGKAILSKAALYEVRPVHSVAGDNLTLGFDLLNAPASGISMGKCVNYAPANEGHPTLSLTLYRGNGGAIEAMAGVRVASGTFSIDAGQFISASYSFQGSRYLFNPVVITTSDNRLDFEDDDGDHAAAITAGIYRDPHEFAAAVQTAMRAVQTDKMAEVQYLDATGQFKVTAPGDTTFELKFASGANTANNCAAKLGFAVADQTGASGTVGYTGSAVSYANAITPAYDSADPQAAKNNECFVGDSTSVSCFCASSIEITVTNEIQNVECICAESGVQEKIINRRTVEISVTAIQERFDADKFKRFRSAQDTRFMFTFGSKSGGNWVPGTICSIYVPVATISSHELGDNNGLVTMQLGIRPYVDANGAGEFYINML